MLRIVTVSATSLLRLKEYTMSYKSLIAVIFCGLYLTCAASEQKLLQPVSPRTKALPALPRSKGQQTAGLEKSKNASTTNDRRGQEVEQVRLSVLLRNLESSSDPEETEQGDEGNNRLFVRERPESVMIATEEFQELEVGLNTALPEGRKIKPKINKAPATSIQTYGFIGKAGPLVVDNRGKSPAAPRSPRPAMQPSQPASRPVVKRKTETQSRIPASLAARPSYDEESMASAFDEEEERNHAAVCSAADEELASDDDDMLYSQTLQDIPVREEERKTRPKLKVRDADMSEFAAIADLPGSSQPVPSVSAPVVKKTFRMLPAEDPVSSFQKTFLQFITTLRGLCVDRIMLAALEGQDRIDEQVGEITSRQCMLLFGERRRRLAYD